MILGCDAAGVDEDGNEVVVHSVIGDAGAGGGDETLDPRRSLLSERYQGTFAEQVPCPRRNLLPKPAELSFEEAACLPTAWLTAYRMLFNKSGVQPGATVLVQGAGGGVATALIVLGRAAGYRVWATSRHEAKREARARARRRPGLRERRAAARAGRRRHRDRRRGHLVPLGQARSSPAAASSSPAPPAATSRRPSSPGSSSRSSGRRLDHGHPGRVGRPAPLLRATGARP